jgi:hypothetical protein
MLNFSIDCTRLLLWPGLENCADGNPGKGPKIISEIGASNRVETDREPWRNGSEPVGGTAPITA